MLITPEQLKTYLEQAGIIAGKPYGKLFKNIDGIAKFLLEFPELGCEKVVKKINLINYGIMQEKDAYYWDFLNLMAQHQFLTVKKVEKSKEDGGKYYYVLVSHGSKLFNTDNVSKSHDITDLSDIPF